MCRVAAPDLVEIQRDYEDHGVFFMTLCRDERQVAQSIADISGLSWPIGYGADIAIERLVGISPCVFVIDRSGRVAWNDDFARLRHDIDSLCLGLRLALDQALAEPAPDSTSH
jgi:hypothetical protein